MNFTLRTALPSDYQTVAALGRETFYETWKTYNTEADMQQYLAESFDEQKVLMELSADENNTFILGYTDNQLSGYAKLRRDRTYKEFRGASVIEVERVYVKKEFQGTGLARALMDRCMEIAGQEKFAWIWLGVNVDNHRAIAFYKKYGFEIFGSKMFKLGEAEDEDYLMRKKLSE